MLDALVAGKILANLTAVGLHDGVDVVALQVAEIVIHLLLRGLAVVDVAPHAIDEFLTPGANARDGGRAVVIDRLEAVERTFLQRLPRMYNQRHDIYRPVGGHRRASRDVLVVQQHLDRRGIWPLQVLDVAIDRVKGRAEAYAHEARGISSRNARLPGGLTSQHLHGGRSLDLTAEADGDFGKPARGQRRRVNLPPDRFAGCDQAIYVSLRQLGEVDARWVQATCFSAAKGDGLGQAHAFQLHVGDRHSLGGGTVDIELDVGSQRHIGGRVLQRLTILVLERPTLRPKVEELREGSVGAISAADDLIGSGRQTRNSSTFGLRV